MSSIASWDSNLVSGLAPVIPLLEDDGITNVDAIGFDEVYAKGYSWTGYRRFPEVRWENYEHFRIACVRVSQVIGRAISDAKPVLNGRLPGGDRVNVAIPPTCERIALTIRKFPAQPMTFDRLQELGSIDHSIRQMCTSLVRARRSILISGGPDAGKTSLLNAFSTAISPGEKVVTLEDARELRIQQPIWVAMETVEPYGRDVEPLTMADLTRNVVRQNPGRIVVGEVRGEEAFYMLRAFSSAGHRGGLGTLHANDAEDALYQVQILAQMARLGLNAQVVAGMVGRSVDVVVHQAYFEGENVKRITEIIELERPGVVWKDGGGFEYKFRHLAQWQEGEGRWSFPKPPSLQLQRDLRSRALAWPTESLEADSLVARAP